MSRLTREDFHLLSTIISTKIFPGQQQGAWFTPAQNGKVAKGMLYSAYVNLRTFLSKHKIIKIRPRQIKTNVVMTSVLTDESSVEIVERFQFIQSNVLPFNELVDAWKVTHLLRMDLLNDPELSTSQYINKFPIFSESNSHEVVIFVFSLILKFSFLINLIIQISLDFVLLFPETVTNINEAWDFYYPFIIKVSSLNKNVEIQNLLKLATGSRSGNFFF